jgi:hypothetical protein
MILTIVISPIQICYFAIMALALGLAFFATQSLWLKRNYLTWFIGVLIFCVIFYLLTPFHNNINTIPIVSMPLYWICLSFVCDLIFKKINSINKNNNQNVVTDFRTYLIFVTIDSYITAYDRKLGKPKPIDYLFSYTVIVGTLLMIPVIGYIWDKISNCVTTTFI